MTHVNQVDGPQAQLDREQCVQVANEEAPAFRPLTGIYEPSAIQQLTDGRFLVVEDEKDHPLSLVTIGADGSVSSTVLTATLLQVFSSFWKLDDLEGLAADRAGFVYAITSHSRDDDGDEKKSRERLARFRVEDERVVDPKVVDGLKKALTTRHAVLAAAAQVRDVKAGGGLNIEALEVTPDQQRLLIGFRSPLRDGRALIASVENLCCDLRIRRGTTHRAFARGIGSWRPRHPWFVVRSRHRRVSGDWGPTDTRTGRLQPLELERPDRCDCASCHGCRFARFCAGRRGEPGRPRRHRANRDRQRRREEGGRTLCQLSCAGPGSAADGNLTDPQQWRLQESSCESWITASGVDNLTSGTPIRSPRLHAAAANWESSAPAPSLSSG